MVAMLISLLLAPVGGFLVGAFIKRPWRGGILPLVVAAPLITHISLCRSEAGPASEPDFWLWWLASLFPFVMPLLLSAIVTVVSFYMGSAHRVARRFE